METKKPTSTNDKLEKDLKTLVSRMKNENTALNKILNKLHSLDHTITLIDENQENQINK